MSIESPPSGGLSPRSRSTERLVARLWDLHAKTVFGVLLRQVRDRETAADLTQETFLSALRWLRAHGVRPADEVNYRAWLLAIARNHVRMERRRRSARPEFVPDRPIADTRGSDRGVDAVARIDGERARAALRGCVEALESHDRALLHWRDRGRSHTSIARRLGISRAATRVRFHRLRRRLCKCVQARLDLPSSDDSTDAA